MTPLLLFNFDRLLRLLITDRTRSYGLSLEVLEVRDGINTPSRETFLISLVKGLVLGVYISLDDLHPFGTNPWHLSISFLTIASFVMNLVEIWRRSKLLATTTIAKIAS